LIAEWKPSQARDKTPLICIPLTHATATPLKYKSSLPPSRRRKAQSLMYTCTNTRIPSKAEGYHYKTKPSFSSSSKISPSNPPKGLPSSGSNCQSCFVLNSFLDGLGRCAARALKTRHSLRLPARGSGPYHLRGTRDDLTRRRLSRRRLVMRLPV
jgi:hypothetical protein